MTTDNMITLEIPRDILDSARLSIPALQAELAVYLYEQGRLSLGKARELAGKTLWEFRHLLAARQIPIHLDQDDLDAEMDTLRALGRL